jgi:hypothetical protein
VNKFILFYLFLFQAAILSSKSILDMSEEEFSRCLNVDLFAAYWVCSFIIMKQFLKDK